MILFTASWRITPSAPALHWCRRRDPPCCVPVGGGGGGRGISGEKVDVRAEQRSHHAAKDTDYVGNKHAEISTPRATEHAKIHRTFLPFQLTGG